MTDDFVLARLIGGVAGKRVLELGAGDGARAVRLAREGATVIVVDPDAAATQATRERATEAEVRVEVHTGDYADLAFLRGDSVDVAFAEDSLGELPDLGRVLRQVQRVLRAGARFAFTLPHPYARCLEIDPEPAGSLPLARPYVGRSYFADDGGVTVHRIADVFAALGRAGFQVDTLLEPEPGATGSRRAVAPDTVVWRARKLGS